MTWTNTVGVAVNGNNLQKTKGDNGWGVGAISRQAIISQSGYVEFTATETQTERICGLSHTDTDQDWSSIDFGIYLGGSNVLQVYESGTNKGIFGTYQTGDVFRIALENGVISYRKNGIVFYTSQKAPTMPLIVDTAFASMGATIGNVIINGMLSGVTSVPQIISGGDQSLFVDSSGYARAWGRNNEGQLGDGTAIDRAQMRRISGISQALATAALGETHCLAATDTGQVYSWGNNYFGQLGDGTTTSRYTPSVIGGLANVTQVAAGDHHSLALRNDGTVWAWGGNQLGQLGDGSTTSRSSPAKVSGLANIICIVAGAGHSAALAADGTVWVWGSNEYGQLGIDTLRCSTVPVSIAVLHDIKTLASGRQHLLALSRTGAVWVWGDNHAGQLGLGTTRSTATPQIIPTLTDVAALAAGANHTVALTAGGGLWLWGANDVGQLGDGTALPSLAPVLSTTSNVRLIAAGRDHVVVMRTDGTLLSWGSNTTGQLGNATIADAFQTTPVVVSPAND